MFTGIVSAQGRLLNKAVFDNSAQLQIAATSDVLQQLQTGDSISVSGVCLTATHITATDFRADASPETLSLTTLGAASTGDAFNLELALRLADRLGGHLVTGHVDGRARLRSKTEEGNAWVMTFEVPGPLLRYIARKGSVCLDGVSLTVNAIEQQTFSVCVIPHTLAVTTLGTLVPGDEVNIEVDMMARYAERLQQEQV